MSETPNPVVLVTEDDPIVRLALVEALNGAGLPTLEAETAREAIAILEHNTDVRVMFTDVEMPGSMDGLALAHYVRYRWPPTIIIVSSGQIRPTPELLPVDAVFLPKPYHREHLDRFCGGLLQRLQP